MKYIIYLTITSLLFSCNQETTEAFDSNVTVSDTVSIKDSSTRAGIWMPPLAAITRDTIVGGVLLLPNSAMDSIIKLPIGIVCGKVNYQTALNFGAYKMFDDGSIHDSTGKEVEGNLKKETKELVASLKKNQLLYQHDYANVKSIKLRSIEVISFNTIEEDTAFHIINGIVDSIKFRLPNYGKYQVYFSCFTTPYNAESRYLSAIRYQDLILYDSTLNKVKLFNLAKRQNQEIGFSEGLFCIDQNYNIKLQNFAIAEGRIENSASSLDTTISLKSILNK